MAKRVISLKSSDGEIFEVEVAVAMLSNVIMLRKHEDNKKSGTGVIPLIFKSDILAKIIEYLKRHCVYKNHEGAGKGKETAEAATAAVEAEAAAVEASVSEVKDLENFDAEFFKDVKREKILEIAEAARYLDVKKLYDLSLQAVADMVKDKTPRQIPARFEIIEPELTSEEEAEMEAEADAELAAEAEAEARARATSTEFETVLTPQEGAEMETEADAGARAVSTENIPENMEISTNEQLFSSVREELAFMLMELRRSGDHRNRD